jgi:hypothetical protein
MVTEEEIFSIILDVVVLFVVIMLMDMEMGKLSIVAVVI